MAFFPPYSHRSMQSMWWSIKQEWIFWKDFKLPLGLLEQMQTLHQQNDIFCQMWKCDYCCAMRSIHIWSDSTDLFLFFFCCKNKENSTKYATYTQKFVTLSLSVSEHPHTWGMIWIYSSIVHFSLLVKLLCGFFYPQTLQDTIRSHNWLTVTGQKPDCIFVSVNENNSRDTIK